MFKLNCVLQVNTALPGKVSLLCTGYIKAGESMGRSDLTDLWRGHNCRRKKLSRNIISKNYHKNGLLKTKFGGDFRGMNLYIYLTGYCTLYSVDRDGTYL